MLDMLDFVSLINNFNLGYNSARRLRSGILYVFAFAHTDLQNSKHESHSQLYGCSVWNKSTHLFFYNLYKSSSASQNKRLQISPSLHVTDGIKSRPFVMLSAILA